MKMIDPKDAEWIRFKVAEKLGWQKMEYTKDGVFIGHPPGQRMFRTIPSYCMDIKAAWEIMDFFAGQKIEVGLKQEIFEGKLKSYRAWLGQENNPITSVIYPKAACALCLVFLAAPGKIVKGGDDNLDSRPNKSKDIGSPI